MGPAFAKTMAGLLTCVAQKFIVITDQDAASRLDGQSAWDHTHYAGTSGHRELWQPDRDGLPGRLFAANGLAITRKNNAADRPTRGQLPDHSKTCILIRDWDILLVAWWPGAPGNSMMSPSVVEVLKALDQPG